MTRESQEYETCRLPLVLRRHPGSGRPADGLMKFAARMSNSKAGLESMTREDTSKELREIFRGYLETKRGLAADVDRLLLKGWPDRKTEAQALRQVTISVMECEILRFEYLLSYLPFENPAWTSLQTTTRRLHTDWRDADEKILSDTNAAYGNTVKKLDAAQRDRTPGALDSPFKDARNDPEFGIACQAFAKRNDELDEQFRALRVKWPKPSSL